MMLVSVAAGERPHAGEWTGLIVALGGLAYLVSPGLEAPEPAGAVLMAAAGTSWGWYTIRGGGVTDALGVTAGNFARTMPLLVALCLFYINTLWFSVSGIVLASGSGMIASGLGYVIWYAALRGLTATRASIIQLAVPAIAALGGVLFLSEEMTMRLMLSAVLILGGIGLALFSRSR
jgi:drug/metabolite transporter (DMT)-like permease